MLVAVLLGVVAYQLTRTGLALYSAQGQTEQLQDRLADGDVDGARASAQELAHSARVAHEQTDGLLWRGLSLLPYVGDEVVAVRDLSTALDRVAREAPAGIDVLADVAGGGLRTDEGGVDLDVVSSLGLPLQRIGAAADSASRTVAWVEPDDLAWPLAGRAAEFLEALEQLRAGTEAGSTAVEVLPELLGAEGPRTYLLIVQNNAEIRSTGGLPGSMSLLHVRDGRVRLGIQGGVVEFQGPDGPYAELLPGEAEVFGDLLVRDNRDSGFTPDFPRAASLWLGHAEAHLDQRLDGVLSLDPVTLAQVLRATGPLEAGGEELTAETAVSQLLFEPYARFEDPLRQDAFFRGVARGLFDGLLQAEGDQTELVRVVAEAAAQRRLLFWTPQAEVQEQIEGFSIAGALPRDTGRPEVGFYLDDSTEYKIDYFLRHRAEITSVGCTDDDRQVVQARLLLKSQVPEPVSELPPYVVGDGSKAPPGDIKLLLRIFAPQGGELTAMEVDGEETSVSQAVTYDREVTQKTVQLEPGQSMEVVVRFVGAPGELGDPRVQWTPGIEWGPSEAVAASVCE